MDKRSMEEVVQGAINLSDKIRRLGRAGYTRAEIAKFVDRRYQHVRKVLLDADITENSRLEKAARKPIELVSEPITIKADPTRSAEAFPVQKLIDGGFAPVGEWSLVEGAIRLSGRPPSGWGVYAFICDREIVYIGVSANVARRMQNYRHAPAAQRTSRRVNALIRAALAASCNVSVLACTPGRTEYAGLPVELSPGLEAALIAHIQPEWNRRG